MAGNSVAEAAAQLRADLQLLDASTKEAASLLDLAAWQVRAGMQLPVVRQPTRCRTHSPSLLSSVHCSWASWPAWRPP